MDEEEAAPEDVCDTARTRIVIKIKSRVVPVARRTERRQLLEVDVRVGGEVLAGHADVSLVRLFVRDDRHRRRRGARDGARGGGTVKAFAVAKSARTATTSHYCVWSERVAIWVRRIRQICARTCRCSRRQHRWTRAVKRASGDARSHRIPISCGALVPWRDTPTLSSIHRALNKQRPRAPSTRVNYRVRNGGCRRRLIPKTIRRHLRAQRERHEFSYGDRRRRSQRG